MIRYVWMAAIVGATTLVLPCKASWSQTVVQVKPLLSTEPVPDDPDDPAIWINRGNPSESLILGTNKSPAPSGSIVVFGLDGKIRQEIDGIDRPNNIDVEHSVQLGGKTLDIAVVTERLQQQIRIFKVDAKGLEEIGRVRVFDGQTGDYAAPMGIGLYRRSRDAAAFAIVGRKFGPTSGYLWQYKLHADEDGRIHASKVREFGSFSGKEEIEAIAVDDELGFVYYADEGGAIRKWHADPDHADADTELAVFGKADFAGDREGIALLQLSASKGYVICSDQIDGDSRYVVFDRSGADGDPHNHQKVLKIFSGGADSTDGIEATAEPLGPNFPHGIFIAMNSIDRNFLLYRWDEVARAGSVRLDSKQK